MNVPWSSSLVNFFENWLEPERTVFAWTSSEHVPWLAQRVKHIVSVEHDAERFQKLLEIENVETLLIEPEQEATEINGADPLTFYLEYSGDVRLRRYASAIDNYELFDTVLVDGPAPLLCLKHAQKHTALRGVLLLNNAGSSRPKVCLAYLFRDWNWCRFGGRESKILMWSPIDWISEAKYDEL